MNQSPRPTQEPTGGPATGPSEGLLHRLLAAAHAAERAVEREVSRASGLSLPQLDFLVHLDEAGGALPLSRVAEGLCCVRSNVTQLADRLEGQGWIAREPDPDDRRSIRAVLTEDGRARMRRGAATRGRVERDIAERAAGPDGDASATLRPFLDRILEGLD